MSNTLKKWLIGLLHRNRSALLPSGGYGTRRQNRRESLAELLEPRALLSAVLAEGGFETPVQPVNNWEQANGTGGGSLAGSLWTITGAAGITRNISPFQSGGIPAPEGVQHGLIQGNGSFRQTVTGFVVGGDYELSLLTMARQSGSFGSDLEVILDQGLGTEISLINIPEVTFNSFTEVVSPTFEATKSSYTLTLSSDNNEGALTGDRTTFFDAVAFGSVQTPFVARTVSDGTRIEAEDFDNGGNGIAYVDTTAGNTGGAYRTDQDVDIQATSDVSGGHNVGWIADGESLEYTADVVAGNYDVGIRVAAASAGAASAGASIRLLVSDNPDTGFTELGTASIPDTGGVQTWTTITLENVDLAGWVGQDRVFRLEMIGGGFNLNWLEFAQTFPNTTATAAVQSGNWNDPATWDKGVPDADIRALVRPGVTVTLDGTDHDAKELVVHGVLNVAEDGSDRTLTSRWIHVNSGGVFQAGTNADRFDNGEFIVTLTGTDQEADHVIETATGTMNVNNNDGFLMTAMNGRLQIFGEDKVSFTKLAATAEAGSTTITVANIIERNFDGTTSAASDGELTWEVGDEIVIASSSYDYNDEEVRTITAVNNSGTETVLTLDAALAHRHYGAIETYGNGTRTWDIDLRAEVALLSRSITIQGTQDTDAAFGDRANYGDDAGQNLGVGAHAMFMPGSGQITIDGARFEKMGQTGTLGRYPIHWHVAGDRSGDILRNSSVTNSNNRGVTIHGAQGVLVEGNVLHDIHGHGFFMEDAAETDNQFLHNITFGIHKVGGADGPGFTSNDPFVVPGITRGGDGKVNGEAPRGENGEGSHDTGQNAPQRFVHSAAYWITNPDNTWVGNIAAGSEGTGFWFVLPERVLGLSLDTGLYNGMNPRRTNLLQFDNNTTHSSQVGLTFDRGEDISGRAQANEFQPPQTMQINGFTGYKNHGTAVYHRASVGIFNESRFADNFHGSFNTFSQEERNILFVGHSRGNAEPGTLVGGYRLYDGPGRILNSHFAGFAADNAHAFRIEGGANKNTHTRAQGISFEADGTADTLGIELYGNAFFSVDDSPEFVAGRPDALSGLVYDVDGSLTGHGGGGAGWVLTPKVDFYRDSTDLAPAGWNGYLSDDRYAQFRIGRIADRNGDYIPPFRISNGDGHSIIADRWNLTYWQRMYTKVNAGDYTVEFLSGVPADGFDVFLNINTVAQGGDATVFRFVDVGKSYKPDRGTEVTSLAALRSAGNTSWFRGADGDLWMKIRESGTTINIRPTTPLVVTNTNDSGTGSLRAVIEAANSNAGFDTITFDIGVDGSTQTIQPQSPLPTITDRVFIDGSTQATLPILDGGFESPVQPANSWELANGSGSGNLAGSQWTIAGGAGIARNLSAFQNGSPGQVPAPEGQQLAVIQNNGSFTQTVSGFEVGQTYQFSLMAMGRQTSDLGGDLKAILDAGLGSEQSLIDIPEVMFPRFTELNSPSFVATKSSYTLTILSDQNIGTVLFDDVTFRLVSPPIVIDGSAAGASNGLEFTAPGGVDYLTVNGFASGAGILLNAAGSFVDNVWSGVAATGTAAANQYGVRVESGGNTIQNSLLSGNTLAGIRVLSADDNIFTNNLIGTDPSGAAALANGINGIEIDAANGTQVIDNTIAFNSEDGVVIINASSGNTISNNSIHSNGQLGIDLGNDGVTANDNLDADTGANDLTNTPVLTSAAAVPLQPHILFHDTFDDSVSTSLTDPSTRATGTLADALAYNFTSANSGEVEVTGGLLDWTGAILANGNLVTSNGKQNWTFRSAANPNTHFDWAPHLAGDVYDISFIYRSAWSQPLTFGISDTPQPGDAQADNSGSYDYAFGSWGRNWDSGEDGNHNRTSGADGDTEFSILLKINEPAGTAEAWVDGSLVITESIDFENPGRYFSFGDANSYGGYIDEFRVFVTPTRYNTSIVGEVNALPNTTYQLEFFENDALDSSGHGEGQTLLHAMELTTDASGDAPFSFNLTTLSPGTFITATATDPSGNTSEFSLGAEVVEGATDLVATAFNAVSDHVLNGQTDVTFTVANTGTSAASAFDTHVVWSPNNILGDADDVVVSGSATTFAGLAGGASETKTISLQLDQAALYAHSLTSDPPGQPVGTVSADSSRLFLVIDINSDVIESDETNNSGQGHLLDSDDITYFAWDKNSNGVVEPLEALTTIRAIGTNDPASDFDGNGIVSPLEALSAVQRIGYVRASVASKSASPASAKSQLSSPVMQRAGMKPVEAQPVLSAETPTAASNEHDFFPVYSNSADDEEKGSLFTVESSESPAVVPATAASATDTVSDTFVTTEWLDVI